MPAPFTCFQIEKGDILIVRSQGYLDDRGGLVVRQAVEASFARGFQKFVLNVAGSPVINSMGVAQILELVENILDQRHGTIAYCGLNELTNGVFKMVGLIKLGSAHPTEDAAIAALSGKTT